MRQHVETEMGQWNYEPICRYTVQIFVGHQRRWDEDGYFLDKAAAMDHVERLREHDFKVRLQRCEYQGSTRMVTEYEEG